MHAGALGEGGHDARSLVIGCNSSRSFEKKIDKFRKWFRSFSGTPSDQMVGPEWPFPRATHSISKHGQVKWRNRHSRFGAFCMFIQATTCEQAACAPRRPFPPHSPDVPGSFSKSCKQEALSLRFFRHEDLHPACRAVPRSAGVCVSWRSAHHPPAPLSELSECPHVRLRGGETQQAGVSRALYLPRVSDRLPLRRLRDARPGAAPAWPCGSCGQAEASGLAGNSNPPLLLNLSP